MLPTLLSSGCRVTCILATGDDSVFACCALARLPLPSRVPALSPPRLAASPLSRWLPRMLFPLGPSRRQQAVFPTICTRPVYGLVSLSVRAVFVSACPDADFIQARWGYQNASKRLEMSQKQQYDPLYFFSRTFCVSYRVVPHSKAIRQKQLAEFNEEEKDLLESISALKSAVTVLSKEGDFERRSTCPLSCLPPPR